MRRLVLALMLVAAACGDDEAVSIDAGRAPDAAGFDCVEAPVTSQDILNACTDAVHVDKQPVLPLQLLDGGLPQLP